ncbi:MAG: 5-formyltetrahydrofolate cyclo-ligase [Demequinaceae bacterium]|nr:5-formyltetrahydrofolate cyclo-ligase [Demequinaceae bacterium]
MPSSATSPAWVDEEAVDDAKAILRTAAVATRSQRSQSKHEETAQAIADHLLALPELRVATCVSIYASRPTEPGTLPTIEALDALGIRVLLPVLGEGLQRCWGEFRGTDDLVQRAPGRPPEPSGDHLPPSAIADADVIVAPALAIDGVGTRLGQGGGWYDRALKRARPDTLLIAAVFADEVHLDGKPLPRATHDVPVHAVVTPKGVTRFTR